MGETARKNEDGWELNTKVDLKERGREDVEWTHLAYDRVHWRAVANTAMNFGFTRGETVFMSREINTCSMELVNGTWGNGRMTEEKAERMIKGIDKS
jgi:hypothetical protein